MELNIISKYMKVIFLLAVLTFNVFAQECPVNRADYFCLPPEKILNKEIDVSTFYTLPYAITSLYQTPLSALNDEFVLEPNWMSPFFGAGVSHFQNKYRLMILGGMTRSRAFTKDAYAAIICHELGHLLGGEPRQHIKDSEWASAEGQADFFAASQCLPKYFRSIGMSNNLDIDKRVEKSGNDFANLAMSVTNGKGETFIRKKVLMPAVNETITERYPSLQCRYETYRNNKQRSTCWFKP